MVKEPEVISKKLWWLGRDEKQTLKSKTPKASPPQFSGTERR